jgi:hypothetical protein
VGHVWKGIEKMNQPCPYVDAKGKCKGHIVRIEAFKADLAWHHSDDGKWTFSVGEPRTHYHLYCSEKGNHAGFNKPDSEKMKFYYRDLPPTLQKLITAGRIDRSFSIFTISSRYSAARRRRR